MLLVSFVPMFLIASSFYYMNRADPDCGTTFSWITRAMGPYLGWLGGWAVVTTGILVIGSLAQVAAFYTFDLFGLDTLRDSKLAVDVVFTLAIIAVMTTICVLGTELSAHVQRVMILRAGRGAAAVRGRRADQGRGGDAPAVRSTRVVLALAVRRRQRQRARARGC